MANTYADVLRVCNTEANLATILREQQFGFATDTHAQVVKAPGGTVYRYSASGSSLTITSGNYVGLGAGAGRIQFDTAATDKLSFLTCYVGVGTASAAAPLHVVGGTATTSSIIAEDSSAAQMGINGGGIWRRDGNGDSAGVSINYVGYLDGVTKYRDLAVCDGKNNTVLFVDGSAASVGVGNAAPTSLFDILGAGASGTMLRVRSTTAVSSIYMSDTGNSVKFNTSNGQLNVNVGGSDRLSISTGGLVGIGISSLTNFFHVAKADTAATVPIVFENSSATQGNGTSTYNKLEHAWYAGNGAVAGHVYMTYESGGTYGNSMNFGTTTNHLFNFKTNNTTRITVLADGRTGFGTSSWSADKVRIFSTSDSQLGLDATGQYTVLNFRNTDTTKAQLVWDNTAGKFFIDTINASYPIILNSIYGGRVGINNVSPGTALDVGGVITATDGTSTQWNTAYTYSGVGHLPLAGGTMTGIIGAKVPTVYATIKNEPYGITAPLYVQEATTPTGSPGFAPMIHGTTVVDTYGYRKHVSIGSYRDGAIGFGGGIYLAQGGNDNWPTEYFLLGYGGVLSHSSAAMQLSGSVSSYGNLTFNPSSGGSYVAATGSSLDINSSYLLYLTSGNSSDITIRSAANTVVKPPAEYTALNAGYGFNIANSSVTAANIMFGLNGSYSNIIQSRNSGSSSHYPLSINPFGGKVGFGTVNPGYLFQFHTGTDANFAIDASTTSIVNIYAINDLYNTWIPLTVYTYNTSFSIVTDFEIVTNNTGAIGSSLSLYHASASPAVDDYPGVICMYGKNSAGTKAFYGEIAVQIKDTTAGSEDSDMGFYTTIAGTPTENMRIHGGNVGIGTPAPSKLLDVYASGYHLTLDPAAGVIGGNGNVIVRSGSGSDIGFNINSDTIGDAKVIIKSDGKVGVGVIIPYATLQVAGAIAVGGSHIPGTDYVLGAVTTGHYDAGPYGWIQSANATVPDTLALNPLGGNVGIGTASPIEKLEVAGGIRVTALGVGGAGSYGQIDYYPVEGSMRFISRGKDATTNGEYVFYGMESDGGGGTTPLVIKASGYVGINNISPATSLDVTGVITATDGNSTNWNTAYTYSGVGHLPLAGGTMTGIITTKVPTVYATISNDPFGITAPIVVQDVPTGSGGFAPMIHGSTTVTSGYRKHVSIGSYRSADTTWNGGIYLAQGGNDNYPTEYFLLGYGGVLSHSSAAMQLSGSVSSYGNLTFNPSSGGSYVAATGSSLDINASNILYLTSGNSSDITIRAAANTVVAPSAAYTAIGTGNGFNIYNASVSSANLMFGVNGTTSNIIQSRDGTSTYYPLSINPFGGNIGFGVVNPYYLFQFHTGAGVNLIIDASTAYVSLRAINDSPYDAYVPFNVTAYNVSFGMVTDFEIVTSNGGSTGSVLSMYHASASPAVDDYVSQTVTYGKNASGTKVTYGDIAVQIKDTTAGSEDSDMEFFTMVGGTLTENMRIHLGRLGIGVVAPLATLQVAGAMAVGGSHIPGTDYVLGAVTTGHYDAGPYGWIQSANATVPDTLALNPAGGSVCVGATSPTLIVSGLESGISVVSTGNNSAGVNVKSATLGNNIELFAAQSLDWVGLATVGAATRMSFCVGAGFIKALNILYDGKIGIGTSSPSSDKVKIFNTSDRQLGLDATGRWTVLNFENTDSAKTQFAWDNNDSKFFIDTLNANHPICLNVSYGAKVGIGTASPATTLDVNGSINIADGSNITWGGAYAANIPTIWALKGASSYIRFAPAGSTAIAMAIINNGNVGIGTIAPGTALEVSGIITATGGTSTQWNATQGNLNTHAGLTTTAHGLGASAFHADSYFALAGHNHSGVYEVAGLMATHESTYAHANIAHGETAYGWGNPSGVYLPLAGGTMTGIITTKNQTAYSAITDCISAPIMGYTPYVTTPKDGPGFVPMIHGVTAVQTYGYLKHVSIGSYREGTNNFAGGIYLAQGGSDSRPTEYFLLGYGGVLLHSNGSTFLHNGNFGSTLGTICQGNDARLSDARTPVAHNQAWSTITDRATTLSGYGITDASASNHNHSGVYDPAGTTATHAGLTTTAHGLGASAFHADSYFALAGHNHSGVYEVAGLMSTHESTYTHGNIAHGETAYEWGNHSGLYSLLNHNHSGVYEIAGLMATHESAYTHANIAHGETAYGWGNPSGVYLPLAGGTMTGIITTKNQTAYSVITDCISAPIMGYTPYVTTPKDGPGFVPMIHGVTAVQTYGYLKHVSIGSYREGTNNFAGGIYLAQGGSDSSPTEYFLLGDGGNLTHSSGKIGIGCSPGAALDILTSSYRGLEVRTNSAGSYVTAFYGANSTGLSFGSYIAAGSNSSDTALEIDNRAGTSRLFMVRGDGNVSIGTTTPDTALHVKKTAVDYRGQIAIEDSANQELSFISGAAGASGLMAYINYNVASSTFQIDTYKGNSPSTAYLRLNPSGSNVAIGNIIPSYNLHIKNSIGAGTMGIESYNTTAAFLIFKNDDLGMYVGKEGSAGGAILAGTTPYAGVLGTASNQPVQISTNNTVRMTILGDGKAGIGCTPTKDFEVARAAYWLENQSVVYSTGIHYPLLELQRSNSDTLGSMVTTVTGQYLGALQFLGVTASTNLANYGASISVVQNGDAGVCIPADMIFNTASSTALNEVMRITAGGLTGFGFASPLSTLCVNGGVNIGDAAAVADNCLNVVNTLTVGGITTLATSLGGLLFATAGVVSTKAIGSDIQAYHANLASLAGLYYGSTAFVKMTGANTFTLDTSTYLTSVTAHNLLSSTHGDTLAGSVARGSIIVGNSTPKWSALAVGTNGYFLKSNGTDVAWAAHGLNHSDLGNLHQDVTTTATPQFARLGIGAAADGTIALAVAGDIKMNTANYFYFGDTTTTTGAWKVGISTDDLVFYRYSGSAWVEKGRFTNA